ncbi:fused phosphoenolpyruvate-protein phosphotransferase PtsP/GAF domain [Kluyvera cryocrescens]|uniref:Fused phosphoenolpyruvate-protein phosphotransferase PtsP/GAF domain n=1 Tax=Kluyvera cryocrescens TaxID=580 RepID=A0A485ARL2_KLUCR|nr:fused phosphoenolpyruvate-protein phosphotransferase PtsP/GAF domain [Kluyvera cryocrescens]
MLRANAATGNLSILLPMITSLEEVDEARRLIDRAGREVEEMIGYAIPEAASGDHAGSAIDGVYAAESGKSHRLYLGRYQ